LAVAAVAYLSADGRKDLTINGAIVSLDERIKLKLHLWICSWCQWYLEHLQIIRETARAQADEPPEYTSGSGLSQEARERIRRRLTNQN